MKALVYAGPRTLVYRDEPDPVPGDGDVLVKIETCGICGSDLHGWHGGDARKLPGIILGHEAAGWVESGTLKGRRVAINPIISCMACENCIDGQAHLCLNRQNLSAGARQGAFAEYVVLPQRNVYAIPDAMDFATASLVEPLAVGYHAMRVGAELLRRQLLSASVLVLGAGPIGLGTALMLQAAGVTKLTVTDINSVRRAVATRAGLPGVVDPSGQELDAKSFDLVIDAVGATETRVESCRVVRAGGVIVHIGLIPGSDGIDIRRITLDEIRLSGSFAYSPMDFQRTLELVAAGRLGAINWTQKRSMSDGHQAFIDVDEGGVDAAKVILAN